MIKLFLLCCFLFSLMKVIQGRFGPAEVIKTEDVLAKLLRNYSEHDAKIAPSRPVNVQVNCYILSIDSVDEMRMEYTMQMYFRQWWSDSRLSFAHLWPKNRRRRAPSSHNPLEETTRSGHHDSEVPSIVSSWEMSTKVWTPDLFFTNEKEAKIHNIMKPNIFLKIASNGTVIQSTRLTVTLACPMKLRFYPMDIQICPLRIESYGYNTDYLTLAWRHQKDNDVPIKVSTELYISNFRLKTVEYNHTTLKFTGVEYDLLLGSFVFEREFSYYLIAIYLPCGMIVVISWVSFWLGDESLSGRVALGITTILTMVTQIYGITQTAPRVPYIKAMDVWNGSCMAFVVLTILEVSVVSVMTRRDASRCEVTNRNGNGSFGLSTRTSATVTNNLRRRWTFNGRRFGINLIGGNQVDSISRVLFPTAFLLFNFSYWGAYLLSEQKIN